MKQTYKISKETAGYLDALRKLEEGASLVLGTAEAIYGSNCPPTDKDVVAPFQAKYDETVSELFSLIKANILVNLGFTDNTSKEEVII